MNTLILIVGVTLIISATCSFWEAILYTMRIVTLEVKARDSALAARALKMKRNISGPISSILILNTVANTAGATLAGVYAAKVFGDSKVIYFSICLTVAILFFSEILPKTLGAIYWRALWPYIVWPITVVKIILYPLVRVSQIFTGLFTSSANTTTITEDEIKALVRVGAREGEISRIESEWVHNLIELEDKCVRDIMTPRTVMLSLEENLSVEQAFTIAVKSGYSRIPVYHTNPENITGYVMTRELSLFPESERPQHFLKDIKRKILFVPGNSNILRLLTALISSKHQITAVVDEYGGIDGMVTMEDVIETILGREIVDENDSIIDLQKFARESNMRTDE